MALEYWSMALLKLRIWYSEFPLSLIWTMVCKQNAVRMQHRTEQQWIAVHRKALRAWSQFWKVTMKRRLHLSGCLRSELCLELHRPVHTVFQKHIHVLHICQHKENRFSSMQMKSRHNTHTHIKWNSRHNSKGENFRKIHLLCADKRIFRLTLIAHQDDAHVDHVCLWFLFRYLDAEKRALLQ